MSTPDQALGALRALLGPANVRSDDATLDAYARSTAGRPCRPSGVVLPGSVAEVVEAVRTAARHRLPLYAISTGHNWGYGDACAVVPGQLILELSRMNRIVSFDRELGVVVLEPGVTQGQLAAYLRAQDAPFWMDSTGAGPDTSLIGNIVERGFGHSPYGNRLLHVAGMEVVLADGTVLCTGFGHYPSARTTHLYPYGIGPWLDGIFTQSNLGIVTRLGLWLMPRAERVNHFLASVERHEEVAAMVDALRPLRMDGTLRSVIHIGNDLRVLSGGMTFPHALTGGSAFLPDEVRARLRREAGVGAWTVSGALYGNLDQVAAARRAVRAALRSTRARTTFLTPSKLRLGAWTARLLGASAAGQRMRGRVALGESLFAMNRGEPNGRFLAGAYWRRKGGLPPDFPRGANPAADGCGLLWISPVLPMRGRDLLNVHDLAQPVFARYGFDLFATFSMINERTLGGVLTIAFDRDDAAETARAQTCYASLFEQCMTAGYIPYRAGLQSMGALDPAYDSYWQTVRKIKDALDPDGILAPGRYEPWRASQRG
ncbi:MAG TPA: FAD-binding oxidoreductase [Telluria sp.]|nr:FAD-binding oxidoreductase [Telluria sp.]